MRSESQLDRFRIAQDSASDGFDEALREIQSGRKRGHWIWYIFPQLVGLGMSPPSQLYGVRGLDEARAYLRDEMLHQRLVTISRALLDQLNDGNDIRVVLGSDIDAMKLASSMTLFSAAARSLVTQAPEFAADADLFDAVLRAAGASGYPPCEFTLKHLRSRQKRDG